MFMIIQLKRSQLHCQMKECNVGFVLFINIWNDN
eukprot:UN10390